MPKNLDLVKIGSSGHTANMEGVAALERGLAIAQALEVERRPLTLTELAQHTGLYKSTVLRLLVSLERYGLVVRRADQSYTLGAFAFRLGKAYEVCMPLEVTLQPLMEQLVRNGMESPSFHVIHDAYTRVCLLRVDSMHSTLDRVRVGDRLPLHAGAPGRVLLGAAPEPLLAAISSHLQISFGERDPNCGAVAGPVFGPAGTLLGALSLSGPLERFNQATVTEMAPVLLRTCQEATANLGGRWPEQL